MDRRDTRLRICLARAAFACAERASETRTRSESADQRPGATVTTGPCGPSVTMYFDEPPGGVADDDDGGSGTTSTAPVLGPRGGSVLGFARRPAPAAVA